MAIIDVIIITAPTFYNLIYKYIDVIYYQFPKIKK